MDSKIYHIITKKAQGGALSEMESSDLEVFLSNEKNNELYDSLVDVWKATSNNSPEISFDVESEWNQFKNTIQKSRKSNIRKLIAFSGAAAASIAILISLFLTFNNTQAPDTIYASGNDVIQVTLSDNSVVTLNKNTTLTVCGEFNKRNRNMSLHGEAFFNVTPDQNLPFKVALENDLVIEVVGTSFNIRSYDTEARADIHVTSGVVDVLKDRSERIHLTKGNKAIYDKSTDQLSKSDSGNNYISAWQTGEFNFDNTALTELKEPFERYFNKEIIFPTTYSSLNYSGQFNKPSAEDFAQTIAISFGWEYSVNEKQIVFSDK